LGDPNQWSKVPVPQPLIVQHGQSNKKIKTIIKLVSKLPWLFVAVDSHNYFGSFKETLRFPEIKVPAIQLELERVFTHPDSFRHVRKITKSFVVWVCPHGTSPLPVHGFP